MKITPLAIGTVAVIAFSCCLGNTSCDSGGAVAAGSSGSGTIVIGGFPPQGILVGVAKRGARSGDAVWWTGTAASIMAASLWRRHIFHLVGKNDVLSTVGDPCQGKTPDTQLWGARIVGMFGFKVHLDCAQWENVKNQGSYRIILKCLANILRDGLHSNPEYDSDRIIYNLFFNNKSDFATVAIDRSTGRITFLHSDNWDRCAKYLPED